MHDRAEEALKFLEKENQEFQNHWVWKNLNCKPATFFEAVKKHVASMNIPPEKWNESYKRAREASRVRSGERRQAYQPVNLRLIGSLKV